MESEGVFPRHQYAYRKGLETYDAPLDIVYAEQVTLDRGRELAVIQIDFRAAFDRVNHSGLLYKLRDVGVGGAVFDVLSGFFSGRVQRVVVDGIRSENVRVVSGVPQGSVLGPLLFLLYTSDLPITLQNTLVSYADDSTLLAKVQEPGSRVQTVLSLNRDLARISDWCKRWECR